MEVVYDTKKELPSNQLHELFVAVGWSDGLEESFMLERFNLPFINSTIVISAWIDNKLIGCVRVLSDKMFRSIIYDLAVLPKFQNQGVGKELIKKCIKFYPDSEWLVETTENNKKYYEKLGFEVSNNVFLTIPCKRFKI